MCYCRICSCELHSGSICSQCENAFQAGEESMRKRATKYIRRYLGTEANAETIADEIESLPLVNSKREK